MDSLSPRTSQPTDCVLSVRRCDLFRSHVQKSSRQHRRPSNNSDDDDGGGDHRESSSSSNGR